MNERSFINRLGQQGRFVKPCVVLFPTRDVFLASQARPLSAAAGQGGGERCLENAYAGLEVIGGLTQQPCRIALGPIWVAPSPSVSGLPWLFCLVLPATSHTRNNRQRSGTLANLSHRWIIGQYSPACLRDEWHNGRPEQYLLLLDNQSRRSVAFLWFYF